MHGWQCLLRKRLGCDDLFSIFVVLVWLTGFPFKWPYETSTMLAAANEKNVSEIDESVSDYRLSFWWLFLLWHIASIAEKWHTYFRKWALVLRMRVHACNILMRMPVSFFEIRIVPCFHRAKDGAKIARDKTRKVITPSYFLGGFLVVAWPTSWMRVSLIMCPNGYECSVLVLCVPSIDPL